VVGSKQTMLVTANSPGVTLVSLDVRFGSMISRHGRKLEILISLYEVASTRRPAREIRKLKAIELAVTKVLVIQPMKPLGELNNAVGSRISPTSTRIGWMFCACFLKRFYMEPTKRKNIVAARKYYAKASESKEAVKTNYSTGLGRPSACLSRDLQGFTNAISERRRHGT
jgi:hypothetical protein